MKDSQMEPVLKEKNMMRKLGLDTILRQFIRSISITISHAVTNALRGWLAKRK
jgi:hypothetical protein